MLWMPSVLPAPRPPPHPGRRLRGSLSCLPGSRHPVEEAHSRCSASAAGCRVTRGLSFLLRGELTEGPETPEPRS